MPLRIIMCSGMYASALMSSPSLIFCCLGHFNQWVLFPLAGRKELLRKTRLGMGHILNQWPYRVKNSERREWLSQKGQLKKNNKTRISQYDTWCKLKQSYGMGSGGLARGRFQTKVYGWWARPCSSYLLCGFFISSHIPGLSPTRFVIHGFSDSSSAISSVYIPTFPCHLLWKFLLAFFIICCSYGFEKQKPKLPELLRKNEQALNEGLLVTDTHVWVCDICCRYLGNFLVHFWIVSML